MVDDVGAEGLADHLARREGVAGVVDVAGDARLVGLVRVALEDRLERQLVLDPVQAGGDHRAQRQVGVDVGARQPVLDPQRLAVADDPQRAGPVVAAPGDRRRRE